jgi:hypothetical protein
LCLVPCALCLVPLPLPWIMVSSLLFTSFLRVHVVTLCFCRV